MQQLAVRDGDGEVRIEFRRDARTCGNCVDCRNVSASVRVPSACDCRSATAERLYLLVLAMVQAGVRGEHLVGHPQPRPAQIAVRRARRAAPAPAVRSEREPSPSLPAAAEGFRFAVRMDLPARLTERRAEVGLQMAGP